METVHTIPDPNLMWLFYQGLFNRITFLLQISTPPDEAILVHSLLMKSKKSLAGAIMYTAAILPDAFMTSRTCSKWQQSVVFP